MKLVDSSLCYFLCRQFYLLLLESVQGHWNSYNALNFLRQSPICTRLTLFVIHISINIKGQNNTNQRLIKTVWHNKGYRRALGQSRAILAFGQYSWFFFYWRKISSIGINQFYILWSFIFCFVIVLPLKIFDIILNYFFIYDEPKLHYFLSQHFHSKEPDLIILLYQFLMCGFMIRFSKRKLALKFSACGPEFLWATLR